MIWTLNSTEQKFVMIKGTKKEVSVNQKIYSNIIRIATNIVPDVFLKL